MSKNKPKESQPSAVKPNTDVDLNDIGVKPLTTFKDAPVVKKISRGDDGKVSTVFDLEAGEQAATVNTRQPFLTKEEVKKIGIYEWRLFREKGVYTTVVNGRRFLLKENVFMDLKDQGLVVLVG